MKQNQPRIYVCYQVEQAHVALAFHDIITMQSKKDVLYLHMEAVVGTETISEVKLSVNDNVVSAAEKCKRVTLFTHHYKCMVHNKVIYTSENII